MPNIKAAEKWTRQTEKRTVRNKDAKSRLKTAYKKGVAGTETAQDVQSAFDKAASKGIIHPNKAARKKSRLAHAIAKAAAAPAKTAKAKPAKAAKAKPAAKKSAKKA